MNPGEYLMTGAAEIRQGVIAGHSAIERRTAEAGIKGATFGYTRGLRAQETRPGCAP
jgi:hypothetical protein